LCALSGGSRCVRFDTDKRFIDGIDPHVRSMFDLHVLDSTPAPCDDFDDHQVKAISTAGGFWTPTKLGLRSSTRSVPMSRLLLAPTLVEDYFTVIFNILIRPIAAEHPDPLPKPLLCVYRVAASDPEANVDPAPPASLSEPVVAPPELPWSPRLVHAAPPPAMYFSGCQLKQISALRTIWGERILRLCLLPSLRLRTFTLTPIY
jgi:hypothetical protein